MITIHENISLKNYNTLRIDAQAKFFVKIENAEELQELMQNEIWNQYPFFILWGGANILFSKDRDGIIIKNEMLGKEIIEEDENTVLLKVGAGELWPALVNSAVDQNYGGLENLAFIPWSVGASAVGNIWAYGSEAQNTIEEVEYVDLDTKEIKVVKNAECEFGYRTSIFKESLKWKVLITSVSFRLKKVNENYIFNLEYQDIQKAMTEEWLTEENIQLKDIPRLLVTIRTWKLNDPRQTGSAGSFFKNPVIPESEYLTLKETYPNIIGHAFTDSQIKLSAWQLIDLSWLKWHTQGNVGVSSTHALVLINLGDATWKEILSLSNHVISEVKKNFGVILEPEVIII